MQKRFDIETTRVIIDEDRKRTKRKQSTRRRREKKMPKVEKLRKILFYGIHPLDPRLVEKHVSLLERYRRCFWHTRATTRQEMQMAIMNHPDTDIVIVIGHSISGDEVETLSVVREVREWLWKSVKVVAAFPRQEFNEQLVKHGCEFALRPGCVPCWLLAHHAGN